MIGDDGGIVVKENDKDELIKAIGRIKEIETRKQMGVRNGKKAAADYSEGVIIPQYTAFYEALTGRGR